MKSKESKFEKYLMEEAKKKPLDEGVVASASPYYDKYVQSMKEKGLKEMSFNAWVDEMEDKTAKAGMPDIMAYLKSGKQERPFQRQK
jgi:hypothetical protein